MPNECNYLHLKGLFNSYFMAKWEWEVFRTVDFLFDQLEMCVHTVQNSKQRAFLNHQTGVNLK